VEKCQPRTDEKPLHVRPFVQALELLPRIEQPSDHEAKGDRELGTNRCEQYETRNFSGGGRLRLLGICSCSQLVHTLKNLSDFTVRARSKTVNESQLKDFEGDCIGMLAAIVDHGHSVNGLASCSPPNLCRRGWRLSASCRMKSQIRRLKLLFHHANTLLGAAQCKLLFLVAFARNGFRSKYILALPDRPSPKSVLYKIAHRLGYRFTQDSNCHPDIIIAWEDCTTRTKDAGLESLAATQWVINLHLSDISKQHVAEVFERTFGYSLQVDPEQHAGAMVRKSNLNARHDGKIIYGPAPRESGFVYQRLINNEVAGSLQDLRVPIFGSCMPYCKMERYPITCRFTLEKGEGSLREVEEVFSADELTQLRRFCAEMRLDYGAIDVLRDSDDGRIYVVDVNTTPFGPMNRRLDDSPWFDRVSWRALEKMCNAFEGAFCASSPKSA
jgi:hypothetical protein